MTVWLVGSASSQEPDAQATLVPPSLEEEVQLALSAAPEHLRAGAGVYALTPAGFRLTRPSANGFTCVVNRDHPRSQKPTCYDAEGTRTVLAKVLFVGELLLHGVPLDEVERRVAAKYASGEFTPPTRSGVAYMLSPHIRNFNPQSGVADSFPPHIMFYAPNLANRDIGTSWDALRATPWLPFVAYEGPHGFLVVVVP